MISNKEYLEYQLKTEREIAKLKEELSAERIERFKMEQAYKLEIQSILHQQEINQLKRDIEPVEPIEKGVKRAKKQADLLLAYTEDRETLEKLGFKFNTEGGNE